MFAEVKIREQRFGIFFVPCHHPRTAHENNASEKNGVLDVVRLDELKDYRYGEENAQNG
jgi:hypothetical protein